MAKKTSFNLSGSPAPATLIDAPEAFEPVQPEAAAPEPEASKSKGGRPKEVDRDRYATRLTPEAITHIKALKKGLKVGSECDVIERAVAHYRAHIIERTRQELHLAPQMDDDAVIARAFKAEDPA